MPNSPDPQNAETSSCAGEDDLLLTRAREGDEKAMLLLFERHSQLIYSVAFRILDDANAAADILMELLLGLWRGTTDFVIYPGNLEPQLTLASRNLAVAAVRQRRMPNTTQPLQTSFTFGIPTAVEHRLTPAQVQSVTASLPAEARMILEMAFFDGRTLAEIASRTGSSPAVVKARLADGLRAIRMKFRVNKD